MSGAGASSVTAAGTSDPGGLSAVEVLDRQLDVSGERLALYESVRQAYRSAASPTDAPRELQQLLERLPLQ